MALSTEKKVLLEGICSNGCIYMNMILTGVEAGMEDGFGLELVYFQLDSNIPCCKSFAVPKRDRELTEAKKEL